MGIVSKTREIFVFIQWLNMGGVIVVYRHFQQLFRNIVTARSNTRGMHGRLQRTERYNIWSYIM
jgi:hypothetical protein